MFSLGVYTWFLLPLIWYINPERYEFAKRKIFEKKGLFLSVLQKSYTIILSILLGYYAYLKLNLKYFWLLFSIFYLVVFMISVTMLALGKVIGFDNQKTLGIKFSKDISVHIKKMKINKSINFVYFAFWIYSWL
jgi:hypothetical protein